MSYLQKVALLMVPLGLGLTSLASAGEAERILEKEMKKVGLSRVGDSQRKQEVIDLHFSDRGELSAGKVYEKSRYAEIGALRKKWRPGQPRWAFVKPYRVFEDVIYIGPSEERGVMPDLFAGARLSSKVVSRDGWLAYCAAKYESFDVRKGTYMSWTGQERLCR